MNDECGIRWWTDKHEMDVHQNEGHNEANINEPNINKHRQTSIKQANSDQLIQLPTGSNRSS